jgi:hypothetical protein
MTRVCAPALKRAGPPGNGPSSRFLGAKREKAICTAASWWARAIKHRLLHAMGAARPMGHSFKHAAGVERLRFRRAWLARPKLRARPSLVRHDSRGMQKTNEPISFRDKTGRMETRTKQMTACKGPGPREPSSQHAGLAAQ